MRAFRRRGRSIAAAWALFAIAWRYRHRRNLAAPRHRRAPRRHRKLRPRRRATAPQQPEAGTAAAPVRRRNPRLPAPAAPAPPRPAETPFAELFAQLTARLVGSVVNVSTQATARAPPGAGNGAEFAGAHARRGVPRISRRKAARRARRRRASPRSARGSSSIPSGLIVTNHHVIANAEQVTVTLSDETVLPAQVVGRDPITDLALLKVEPKTPLPAVDWGDSSKARVGDWVLTIGNPFGLGGSVAAGIISARGARHPFRPLRRLSPDRRRDQPRQFRRSDVQHRRRGDRDQHGRSIRRRAARSGSGSRCPPRWRSRSSSS